MKRSRTIILIIICGLIAILGGAGLRLYFAWHTSQDDIRKAFENAMAGNGFSLVEVVSTCNSGWKLSPVASNKWLEENMLPFYQLGDIKDLTKK